MHEGRHRFRAGSSRARVAVHAPGHRFRAEGTGLEGTFDLGPSHALTAAAAFALASLDAGDPLGNRELHRFLDLGRRPVARGEIRDPITLRETPDGRLVGKGMLSFSIGDRTMTVPIELEGRGRAVRARFMLSFTGLGYEPPKLLFFRVKDLLEVEVEAESEDAPAPAS